MARTKKKIKQKPVLFIACEGTSSEYQYFQSWAQTDEVLDNYNRIDVYPGSTDKNPKTTPYEMFELAKMKLQQGIVDFAWIVFDKDNHPKLTETFVQAQQTGIKIAFSSRSFEQWVILHFEKSRLAFDATECKDIHDKPIGCGSAAVPNCAPIDCLTGHIRRQRFIAGYSKKKEFDIFTHISERTEVAIVNSAWLRAVCGASINNVQPPLIGLNPYTDVDQLILQLHARREFIEWGDAGVDITLNRWTINVAKEGANLRLILFHNHPNGQLVNANFQANTFFTSNEHLQNTVTMVVSEEFLINDKGSTLQMLQPDDKMLFLLNYDGKPYFLFHIEHQMRIYITL